VTREADARLYAWRLRALSVAWVAALSAHLLDGD
jgi:hypothetical protein